MTRTPDHLDHLADALSEDIIAAPAERIVAEAAEDAGDAGAFAAVFDRVAVRATQQARRRQLAGRMRAMVSALAPRRSWRPALAAAVGVAVIAVAGDIYLHVQPELQVNQAATSPIAAARDPVPVQAPVSQVPAPQSSMPQAPAPQEASPQGRMSQEGALQRHFRIERQIQAPSAAPPEPMQSAAPVSPPAVADQPGAGGSRGRVAAGPPLARPQPVASEDRLRALINDAQKQVATEQAATLAKRKPAPPAVLGGATRADVPTPFIWPLYGRLIAHVGPEQGAARTDGVDIAAPVGSDVAAAADGVVVYAGNDIKGFGNLVLVRHPDGFVTAYAYASALLVKRDDAVRRGQVIAKSGRGGAASTPMLHFELRKNATPVDLAQYLPAGGPEAMR